MPASGKPQAEDRQLAGVGYRRDSPPITIATGARGAPKRAPTFLRAGLRALIPVTALIIPAWRSRAGGVARGDLIEQFAANTAGVQTGRPRRARRSMLLAALAGGVAVVYLAWQCRKEMQAVRQESAPPAKRAATDPREALTDAPTIRARDLPREEYAPNGSGMTTSEQSAAGADNEGGIAATSIAQDRQEAIEAEQTLAAKMPAAPPTIASPRPAAESVAQPAAAPITSQQEQAAAEAAPVRATHAELAAKISAHMTIVDHKGTRVGAVERVEGTEKIKLTKDGQGRHHWVPLSWVTRVDTQVHLDRSGKDARQAWKARQPKNR